jgi:tetratricopeptide (TPR) repeat protein
MKTVMNLANTLYSQGTYADANKQAETMYRELLPIQQRVLGPEHPNTLLTAVNLASALHSQGKYAEAETTYREVLRIQQRVLGLEHPDTVKTANDLATCVRASRGISDIAK